MAAVTSWLSCLLEVVRDYLRSVQLQTSLLEQA